MPRLSQRDFINGELIVYKGKFYIYQGCRNRIIYLEALPHHLQLFEIPWEEQYPDLQLFGGEFGSKFWELEKV